MNIMTVHVFILSLMRAKERPLQSTAYNKFHSLLDVHNNICVIILLSMELG